MTASPACCIIAGGETTVTIKGDGKGGRNQEMALSAAKGLSEINAKNVECVFLAGGTDGTDGPTDAAGGIVDQNTVERANAKGLNVDEYLRRNDSYNFFKSFLDLSDSPLVTFSSYFFFYLYFLLHLNHNQ